MRNRNAVKMSKRFYRRSFLVRFCAVYYTKQTRVPYTYNSDTCSNVQGACRASLEINLSHVSSFISYLPSRYISFPCACSVVSKASCILRNIFRLN